MDGVPDSSSLVHTHELSGLVLSNSNVLYEPSGYERIRHSHWKHKRVAVFNALKAAGASSTSLDRFIQCGSCCQIGYSPSNRRVYLSCSSCRNRFCEPCSNSRRSLIAHNLTTFCEDKHLRMITLTIAHHSRPLPDLLTRLQTCFKLLRKEPAWKSHVTGFAAFIEVKWSDRTKWFHVHLHILCEGIWWDNRELAATWHKVTGDSFITDIREVKNAEGVRYAAKYASKPFDICDLPVEQRTTCIQALARRRLWIVGGIWSKLAKLTAVGSLPNDLTSVGSFQQVLDRCHQGDRQAGEIINAILGERMIELQRPEDLDFDSA